MHKVFQFIADALRPRGSRVAHLHDLPKTHKEQLAVRPILAATYTYNYSLVKWHDETFVVQSIYIDRGLENKNGEILVSYDVASLFSNVTLEKTIQRLAEKVLCPRLVQQDTWLESL